MWPVRRLTQCERAAMRCCACMTLGCSSGTASLHRSTNCRRNQKCRISPMLDHAFSVGFCRFPFLAMPPLALQQSVDRGLTAKAISTQRTQRSGGSRRRPDRQFLVTFFPLSSAILCSSASSAVSLRRMAMPRLLKRAGFVTEVSPVGHRVAKKLVLS